MRWVDGCRASALFSSTRHTHELHVIKQFLLLLTLNVIFSIGVLPLRLHWKSMPCSLPTINLVGIVCSYSSTETPWLRSRIWSSLFSGSIRSVSMLLLRLRISHQITWPSAPPEKNSVWCLLLIQSTRLARSRCECSRGVDAIGSSLARTSQAQHCPLSRPLTRKWLSLCWYSTQIDGLFDESVWRCWFGFSVSQMYELAESWRVVLLKLVSQYVMAILKPPSGDHDKWLIGRCSRPRENGRVCMCGCVDLCRTLILIRKSQSRSKLWHKRSPSVS